MKRKWPYSMKKKVKQTRCCVCGITLEQLEGKTMPGIIRGMCHKDYTLFWRYEEKQLVKLIRSIEVLRSVIKKQIDSR